MGEDNLSTLPCNNITSHHCHIIAIVGHVVLTTFNHLCSIECENLQIPDQTNSPLYPKLSVELHVSINQQLEWEAIVSLPLNTTLSRTLSNHHHLTAQRLELPASRQLPQMLVSGSSNVVALEDK